MAKPIRVVLTGDVHVGRRPSRVSEHIDCKRCSCAAAWGAVVEFALGQAADVVAISGDLVDRDNRFYEAFGPIERGLRRLAEAGIETVAVAGNHDFDALPKLADHMASERFRVLGRGGQWQRHTIERDGRPVMHVDGWSFPAESHLDNPLRGVPAPPADGLPVLGLLHADLDQPGSRYAPVGMADLRAACHRLWVLGHVHKPALHEAENCAAILYPGSPQGMDPGETGAHGPWLLELDGSPRLRPRHVPMCRVRYEEIGINLGGAATTDELRACILKGLRSRLESFSGDCGPLELVSTRLVLTGRTPLHRRLQNLVRDIESDLELTVGPFDARVEGFKYHTRPAIDLADLARGTGPPAALARLLGELEREGPSSNGSAATFAGLVDDLTRRLGEVWEARPYLPLCHSPDAERPPEPAPDAARARLLLQEQGLLLLDEMLAQKDGAA